MANKTFTYPLKKVEMGTGPIRLRHNRVCLRHTDKDGQEIDLVGNISTVDELLEGPAWLDTVRGSRLPAAVKGLREGCRHDWNVKPGVLTQEEWQSENPELEFDLWKLEKDAKQKLIWIEEVEAVEQLHLKGSDRVAKQIETVTDGTEGTEYALVTDD